MLLAVEDFDPFIHLTSIIYVFSVKIVIEINKIGEFKRISY